VTYTLVYRHFDEQLHYTTFMSDYDSDDALFDSIDIDQVVETQSLTRPKRTRGASTDGSALSVKRQREDTQTSVSIHSEDFDDDDYGESEDHNPHASERLKVAQRLLQEAFGYADFRHEQKNAILRILDKKNTLIVFPTGAGKSLCYQVR
jgi:superfamily II DNA helicase RecQ